MCRILKCLTKISFLCMVSWRASSGDMDAGKGVTRDRLVRSTFLRTSLATMYEPMLVCFAKKIMTLSLATRMRMFALLALVTVNEMNWPIIKWRSRAERCVARVPTTNFSRIRASRYTSVFSSRRSSRSKSCSGSTRSRACAYETLASFFCTSFLISTIALSRFFAFGKRSSFSTSILLSSRDLMEGRLAKLSFNCDFVLSKSAPKAA